MTNNSYMRRGGACIVGVLLLGLAACKSTATSSNVTVVAQTVTVVGLNTDESLLLSDIYSAALQKSGFRVARRDPVADLAAGYAALNSGAADLFVTSTGQLLAYLAANVAAAEGLGFAGLVFTDPATLRADLERLLLLPPR